MAEKEVCADVMTKAEESGGRVEGESLLLPLLQGLLDAPDNEQTADSGTESGEDLRSGLLVEVNNVLTKLANSLKSETSEMPSEKRTSLLQLVTRLQVGLSATPASGERRGSGPGRFARRRRQNRHTVGVSSEELESARRLMAEFGLCDTLNATSSKLPLQKQNSEGSVLQRDPQIKPLISSQGRAPVKNSVAKPYGGSTNTSQSQSGTSSTVDTPEVSDQVEFSYMREPKPPDTERIHSATPDKTETVKEQEKKMNSNSPHLNSIKLSETMPESETDEDTIKAKQTPISTFTPKKHFSHSFKGHDANSNLILRSNPIYTRPKTPDPGEDAKANNRFNSKKLKMKRANTIDIPKPTGYHESEDDYESDASTVDKQNARRNNYLALRGPIRIGRNVTPTSTLPVFEPKTESDKKFMAFINKHNEDNAKGSLWAPKLNDKADANWTNRFGNIKTAFEKVSTGPTTPTSNMNSARNFWKTAETAANTKTTFNGQIPKQGTKNIQQMFEEKTKPTKAPWSGLDEKNIVTGSLKVETKGFDAKKNYKFVPQPVPVNKFSHAPTSAFAAIPKKNPPQMVMVTTPKVPEKQLDQTFPIAPLTPENIIKSDFKETDSDGSTPLYLYSPKPLNSPPTNVSTNTSPATTPWANNFNEHRVHKLAVSKFENHNVAQEQPVIKPRRLSKEKFAPLIQEPVQNEKLTAPYLVKSIDNTNVRKISNQFNRNTKTPDSYSTFTSVKYGCASPNIQDLDDYQPQNYSITYGNPKIKNITKINDNQHYQKFDEPQKPISYSNHYKPTHPKDQNVSQTQSYPPQRVTTQDYNQNLIYKPKTVTQKLHSTPKVYHNQPVHSPPQEYTSQRFIQFNPVKKEPQRQSSLDNHKPLKPKELFPVSDSSTPDSSPTPQRPVYNRQSSQESLHEYEAAVAKVMRGPVSHQAVTVQQKSPKGRNEHDMEAAFSLKNVLQKFSQQDDVSSKNWKNKNDIPPERKLSIDSSIFSERKNSNDVALQRTEAFKKANSFNHESRTPSFLVNGKPLSTESTEINEDGESVVTSKFHIPVTINKTPVKEEPKIPSPTRQLCKSDSWHQLMHEQQQLYQKPSPSPSSKSVGRSKSSHTLAVPTIQFQAGMTKDEVAQKKKTVEAYFSGKTSPSSLTPSDDSLDKSDKVEVKSKSTINRKKTSEKVSIHKHIGGVARSRTLPNIVCPNMLDETNVDEAFEDLFRSVV